MLKGEFNISKARKNLLVLDYVGMSISLLSIMINLMISYMIMDSDALIVLRLALVGSIILFIKCLSNIRKYYLNKDELFGFIKSA